MEGILWVMSPCVIAYLVLYSSPMTGFSKKLYKGRKSEDMDIVISAGETNMNWEEGEYGSMLTLQNT